MRSLISEEDLEIDLSFRGTLAWIAKSKLTENFEPRKNVSLSFEGRHKLDRNNYQPHELVAGGLGHLSITKIDEEMMLSLTMPISLNAAQFLQSMSGFSMRFDISDQTFGSTQYVERYRIEQFSISEKPSEGSDL